MSMESLKTNEIKRLTAPLKIDDFRAYDRNGNAVKCTETLSDIRFAVEPSGNLLDDNEILQYAPQSKAASRIRLKRGFGDVSDILLVHESLPWVLGLLYVILICITVPVVYTRNVMVMYVLLVLFILPLLYSYYIFNFKNYTRSAVGTSTKEEIPQKNSDETSSQTSESEGLPSLKKYEGEIHDLKVLFDVKEEVVRNLIEKRFEPPQITYDKFISLIDSCHKMFYAQSDAALNIIRLAVEDTPRVENEIRNKINILKTIINQIEELTNELVININSSDESQDEVKNLMDDMENLIDSVKDY